MNEVSSAALNCSNPSELKMFIDSYKENVNTPCKNGFTPVMLAVSSYKSKAFVDIFLSNPTIELHHKNMNNEHILELSDNFEINKEIFKCDDLRLQNAPKLLQTIIRKNYRELESHLRLSILNGCDPNYLDVAGNSALVYGLVYNISDICLKLIVASMNKTVLEYSIQKFRCLRLSDRIVRECLDLLQINVFQFQSYKMNVIDRLYTCL